MKSFDYTHAENDKKIAELKSHFVSMTSHEIRSPLAIMQSIIELMEIQLNRSNHPANSELNEGIFNLKNEIGRMETLVDNVLVISRINDDKILINKQPYNIIELITEVVNRVNLMQADGRKIVFTPFIQQVMLTVDKDIINHAFENLLSNAFKYSRGFNAPEINAAITKKSFVFSVTDFGIGIPQNQQQHIFETFYRASNAKKVKGTGLGLFIVKSFVELLGGAISFNSKETKGTTFTVKLPLK
jgi:signal transduction histidine kinase